MRIAIETKRAYLCHVHEAVSQAARPPSGSKTVFATPIYDEREGGTTAFGTVRWVGGVLPVECSVPARDLLAPVANELLLDWAEAQATHLSSQHRGGVGGRSTNGKTPRDKRAFGADATANGKAAPLFSGTREA
ncbi:hypothetical protein MRX96_026615 [Rhipicephalus microplus]